MGDNVLRLCMLVLMITRIYPSEWSSYSNLFWLHKVRIGPRNERLNACGRSFVVRQDILKAHRQIFDLQHPQANEISAKISCMHKNPTLVISEVIVVFFLDRVFWRTQDCSKAKYMIHHARWVNIVFSSCAVVRVSTDSLCLSVQLTLPRRSGGLASVLRGLSSVRLPSEDASTC